MSYKAYALGQRIGDELAKRLSTMAPVTVGNDGNGNTTISCGAGTAGSKSAFIRFVAAPTTPMLNAIGQAADSYAQTIVQLVTESVDATLAHTVGYLTPVELGALMAVLITFGARLDWYQVANGSAPAVAGITGTPVSSVYPNLYNGSRSAQ